MTKRVAILMATYNGEPYIREQIGSIIRQTYQDWELFIRDDGSTDLTKEIIRDYMAEDSRIHLFESRTAHHGAFINFHYLLNDVKDQPRFDYYYFADQDDIWLEEKLDLVNQTFNQEGIPEFIYSDMTVVDGDNQVLIASQHQDRGLILPNDKQLYFVHLYIWGCVSAFNRELFELVPKVDVDTDANLVRTLSHDNYYAKCALEFGKVTFLDKPLIRYRRHTNNVSAMKKSKESLWEFIKDSQQDLKKTVESHANGYRQSLYLIETLQKNGLSNPKLEMIKQVIEKGGFGAVNYLRKNDIKKRQGSKTMLMYGILLLGLHKPYLSKK